MPQSNEDDFETRLTRVEREVVRLRNQTAVAIGDAQAARIMAAGADNDVSQVREELRAHTQSLMALRETQLEHHAEMRQFKDETRANFAKVDENFAKVDENFAKVNARLTHITTLIEGIAGSR